jgi:valyl-tRNA synthetase
VEALARARPLELAEGGDARPEEAATSAIGAFWLGSDQAASEAAAARASARRAEVDQQLARLRDLLANPQFVERAPEQVVERERARLNELQGQLAALGTGDAADEK